MVDAGHVYEFWTGAEWQKLTFVKRSGEMVHYDQEWPGVQSQEVMRALIHHFFYRGCRGDNVRTAKGFWPEDLVRSALFHYEVRAYRRKRQKINQKLPAHESGGRPRPWRQFAYDDVLISEEYIERLPIGDDGHVKLEEFV